MLPLNMFAPKFKLLTYFSGDGSKLGYNMGHSTTQYPSNQPPMQFDRSPFIPEPQFNGTQLIRNSASTSSPNPNLLALAPPPQTPQTLNLDFSQQHMDSLSNPYGRVDDYLMEEEIRMRSHEILENEEMQQLLRVLTMGGAQGTSGMADDGYGFSSYMNTPGTTYGFDTEERGGTRSSSGKAVVGWLKIKAAMRWGIFVRKKAAERRAQLVELDDWWHGIKQFINVPENSDNFVRTPYLGDTGPWGRVWNFELNRDVLKKKVVLDG